MSYYVLIQAADDVINFKIYLKTTSKAMADGEKKRKRREYKKFEYLENEKSFLDEKKIFFIVFEGLLFGEK